MPPEKSATEQKNCHIPISETGIIPGDPAGTLHQWCAANGWRFVSREVSGLDSDLVEPMAAHMLLQPHKTFKTSQNQELRGYRDNPGQLVRLVDVFSKQLETTGNATERINIDRV